MKNIFPESDRNVPILCKSGGWYNVGITYRHSIGTGKYNEHNNEESKRNLNYAESQQDTIVTYHASDMILECHSNAF